MYDLLYSKPQKHIILGPGCSEVLEVAAQVTPAWNITHVSRVYRRVIARRRKRTGLLDILHMEQCGTGSRPEMRHEWNNCLGRLSCYTEL